MFKAGVLYLTDGGLETSLIFQYKIELKLFAAFLALTEEHGTKALQSYYGNYISIAKQYSNCGFILDTPTWRASSDWFNRLGISLEDGTRLIHKSVKFMKEIRKKSFGDQSNILIAGVVGPRGDGYTVDTRSFSMESFKNYHSHQIIQLKESGVDYISAVTMTNISEAMGITLACYFIDIPCVISFTVETNGFLPSGECLVEALQRIDEASNSYPLHYMINCAHPSHFSHLWNNGDKGNCIVLSRIRGLRCNASSKSHQELDESTELDEGDIPELAQLVSKFSFPGMPLDIFSYRIVGGCCGTDHRHVASIVEQL